MTYNLGLIGVLGQSAEELKEMSEKMPKDSNTTEGAVGSDLDYRDLTVEELLGESRGTSTLPLHRISPNDWVSCGAGLYVLELFDKGFIRVKKGDEGE